VRHELCVSGSGSLAPPRLRSDSSRVEPPGGHHETGKRARRGACACRMRRRGQRGRRRQQPMQPRVLWQSLPDRRELFARQWGVQQLREWVDMRRRRGERDLARIVRSRVQRGRAGLRLDVHRPVHDRRGLLQHGLDQRQHEFLLPDHRDDLAEVGLLAHERWVVLRCHAVCGELLARGMRRLPGRMPGGSRLLQRVRVHLPKRVRSR